MVIEVKFNTHQAPTFQQYYFIDIFTTTQISKNKIPSGSF